MYRESLAAKLKPLIEEYSVGEIFATLNALYLEKARHASGAKTLRDHFASAADYLGSALSSWAQKTQHKDAGKRRDKV
jgi:hypothetical protein